MPMLAAALVAAVLLPAPAHAAATVCNRYCDGRDAALSPVDRQPVASTLFGRRFVVHVNDTDAMIWGSVENGSPTDEVWLDRSFDGGRTTADSRLGFATIPSGATSRRTLMYNVDNWSTRAVGALRACGKAGNRPEISCTAWARTTWNAWDRRTAAATALMMRYNQGTGLFDTNDWWTSANSVTALIENMRRSGMRSYDYLIANTYDRNVNAKQGQFRNEYLDDTGWWGLAWIAAYDLTGDVRYLNTARADADYMQTYWDTRCGGGVYWKTDRASKNAIENSLYIQLTAALSRRILGDTVYRGRALATWSWFQSTGMVNGSNLVNDGISLSTCRNNGSTTWTYNQGALINGLVELNRLTGDANVLAAARRIGDALTASTYLSPGGILREPNESNTCSGDGASFKGAAIRGLGVLNTATGGAYNTYLQRNADKAYTANRDTLDFYGSHWAGPFVPTNHSCQHSVLDLLNAAP
ncbi:putative alpha-1,6-mannanase (GH76 family) [Allocatelliglobosispora scoriae]|uniref:Putative alpha-1,6-mannanase (GH76 family) n=1 Tax=Allocatelliglobosispora scoriae TaxID=643052 RepID=A0A841C2G9_9ACTN|nr:glycoside hydrolase family 76 protein [Allocatelliglobosispora scoriae]MBB5873499.1 putative alpha-1,6-mannanase (GH76 family) [Allocatelliglobosispora scoriae]